MEALSVGLLLMLWLGVGGWAFRRLADEMNKKDMPGLFGFCLVLAPFAAGAAIAEMKKKPATPDDA